MRKIKFSSVWSFDYLTLTVKYWSWLINFNDFLRYCDNFFLTESFSLFLERTDSWFFPRWFWISFLLFWTRADLMLFRILLILWLRFSLMIFFDWYSFKSKILRKFWLTDTRQYFLFLKEYWNSLIARILTDFLTSSLDDESKTHSISCQPSLYAGKWPKSLHGTP